MRTRGSGSIEPKSCRPPARASSSSSMVASRRTTASIAATMRRTMPLRKLRARTSMKVTGPPRETSIDSIDVSRGGPVTFIDVRARSFRRGMVRRIVAAMLAVVRREATIEELEDALAGGRHDFGSSEPEPLVLMDVRYDFPFQIVLKPKVAEDIRRKGRDLSLQLHLLQVFRRTMGTEARSTSPDQRDIGFAQ